MENKTVNITNFIGVYDNYITKEECNKAIKLYENQNKFNTNSISLHVYAKPYDSCDIYNIKKREIDFLNI